MLTGWFTKLARKGLLEALLGGVIAAGLGGLITAPSPLNADNAPQLIGASLGGDTSRPAFGTKAFTLSAANLSRAQTRVFFFGNRLFNTNWTVAPASVTSFDGVGPFFNRVSCSGCHVRDGRGQPPANAQEEMLSMLVRISLPGRDAHGGPKPHPVYGDQISDRAIQDVAPEARATLHWEEIPGAFPDGTPYSLRKPILDLDKLAYGPLPEDLLTSPRVAPVVIGLGLLEAVPESTILSLADPDDRDGDGVSGRPNRVWDMVAEETALGRFGWKANEPTLLQQNASAALGDIGLTNPLRPDENCREGQVACAGAFRSAEPDLSATFLEKLTLYTQTIAVPLRRDVDDPQVRRGESLFSEIGCGACHTPTLRTGSHAVAELSGQTIHPFTDLLLHDMGDGLADGRPDFEASGREWRTPPLWGIGLVETVNGHSFFLHDGRARNLTEAILWHGGEAETAREAFKALDEVNRDALIAFLNSL